MFGCSTRISILAELFGRRLTSERYLQALAPASLAAGFFNRTKDLRRLILVRVLIGHEFEREVIESSSCH